MESSWRKKKKKKIQSGHSESPGIYRENCLKESKTRAQQALYICHWHSSINPNKDIYPKPQENNYI